MKTRFFPNLAKSDPQSLRASFRRAAALAFLILASAQLFAASATELPVLRLGIEGRLDNAYDLTLKVASDGHAKQVIAQGTWNGIRNNSSDTESLSDWPRLYVPLQPETVYYLHAISSERTSGQNAQILLDPPPGYLIHINAYYSNGIAKVRLLNDGSSTFMISLVRKDQEELRAGESLPPDIGPDYLLEISLGNLPNGAPAGWIGVKKAALFNGDFSRDMLQLRKDFLDISAIYEKQDPSRIAYYKTDRLEVRFEELPPEQGRGCAAEFYRLEGEKWIRALNYTFKQGASERELIVAKDEGGETSQISFQAQTHSMARVTSEDGVSLKLEMGEMGALGTPVTFAVASKAYNPEDILSLRDGDPIYAISKIVYELGSGEQIVRDNPNPTHDTLLFHYPAAGNYQGTITALINEYRAEDGRYSLSSEPIVARATFEIVVDDSVVWTITQEGRRRRTIERKTTRTGEAADGFVWNVRDTVTSEMKTDVSDALGATPDWKVEDKEICYYEFFDFGGNERVRISPERYGFKRYQTVLRAVDEVTDGETSPSGEHRVTVYTYFDDPTDPAYFGKLQSVKVPSGSVSYFSYDESLFGGRQRHSNSTATHVIVDENEILPSTPEQAFRISTSDDASM